MVQSHAPLTSVSRQQGTAAIARLVAGRTAAQLGGGGKCRRERRGVGGVAEERASRCALRARELATANGVAFGA